MASSTLTNVILRAGNTESLQLVVFAPHNTPHSKLVSSYGVAYRPTYHEYIPVSRKSGEWKELARNPSGGTSFSIGRNRWGGTDSCSVTARDLERHFISAPAATGVGGGTGVSARPHLKNDSVLVCDKTGKSQYVRAGTSMPELEILIVQRGMDKACVRIFNVLDGRKVYTTETIVVTKLAI